MNKIYLLDCTLRDGGYVNNWIFGKKAIYGIKQGLEQANIDILELGFLRNETWDPNRTVFSNGTDFSNILQEKKKGVLYSVMIEGGELDRLYPLEKLGSPEESGIDYIRVCIWKRLCKEHLQYCKEIANIGYKVSIQPTVVSQYNDEEFIEMLKLYNEVNPFAVYIVDTWGTQSSKQVKHYVEMADEYLNSNVKIGYHGHNNKMQALSCTEAVISMDLHHDICIDSSIMGMGRGAGNLATEVIMDYLNEVYSKRYDPLKTVSLFSRYLKLCYLEHPWGYSMYHYLASLNNCAQDFATYFKNRGVREDVVISFLEGLTQEEKTVFNKSFVEEKLAGIVDLF